MEPRLALLWQHSDRQCFRWDYISKAVQPSSLIWWALFIVWSLQYCDSFNFQKLGSVSIGILRKCSFGFWKTCFKKRHTMNWTTLQIHYNASYPQHESKINIGYLRILEKYCTKALVFVKQCQIFGSMYTYSSVITLHNKIKTVYQSK